MNALLMILSLLTALLPLAERGAQYAQQRQAQQMQQAQQPQQFQQPRIVFHNGRWWKWDGQQWWVWTETPTQAPITHIAQGGVYVSR